MKTHCFPSIRPSSRVSYFLGEGPVRLPCSKCSQGSYKYRSFTTRGQANFQNPWSISWTQYGIYTRTQTLKKHSQWTVHCSNPVKCWQKLRTMKPSKPQKMEGNAIPNACRPNKKDDRISSALIRDLHESLNFQFWNLYVQLSTSPIFAYEILAVASKKSRLQPHPCNNKRNLQKDIISFPQTTPGLKKIQVSLTSCNWSMTCFASQTPSIESKR